MPAISNPQSESTSTTATSSLGKCPLCGAPLENPTACSRCDWIKGYGQPSESFRRNPRDTIAAVLSLIWPGIGHFYKGQKAWGFAGIALGFLCFLWAITFFMFFGFLVFPACWIFFAIDAFFKKDLKAPNAAPAKSPSPAAPQV